MYVGRKRKAEPLSGAVRSVFLLRHSPRQCTMQPNMAEHSLSHGVRIRSPCQSSRCLSSVNVLWMFVCVRPFCREMSKQVEIISPLNLMHNASWQPVESAQIREPVSHVRSFLLPEISRLGSSQLSTPHCPLPAQFTASYHPGSRWSNQPWFPSGHEFESWLESHKSWLESEQHHCSRYFKKHLKIETF